MGSSGSAGDGANRESRLSIGPGGVLYGTTACCGVGRNYGTVFSLTPPASPGGNWIETILHAFGGNDGGGPGAVIVGAGGVLYGTTSFGGTDDFGTVFGLPL